MRAWVQRIHVRSVQRSACSSTGDLRAALLVHDMLTKRLVHCRCRALFVDSEPKVVRGVATAIGTERVQPQCALIDQSGRGNNWAAGYNGTPADGGNRIAEAALEALRWQWERSDWCAGATMCHSLGGGTGSGLGSLLLQVRGGGISVAAKKCEH